MKRGRAIALAVLLAVIATVAAFMALRPREPVFQGNGLSEWLDDYQDAAQQDGGINTTMQAVRAMGTNAVPFLRRALHRRDNGLDRAYRRLWPKLPAWLRDRVPKPRTEGERIRTWAPAFLRALGPAALRAIPDLVNALEDESWSVRYNATVVLGELAPNTRDAGSVASALFTATADSNATVRGGAYYALGKFTQEAKAVMPHLGRGLEDKSPYVRSSTIAALAGFGSDAKETLPKLIQALADSDAQVRQAASNALARIDPERATKAGVK